MAKVHYKVKEEDLQTAIANGIPAPTFYYRMSHGWDLERAKTEKPRAAKNSKERSETGEYKSTGLGKIRQVRFASDLDDPIDNAIEKSGLTTVDFFRKLEPEIEKLAGLSLLERAQRVKRR
jgi:hypothetical protein